MRLPVGLIRKLFVFAFFFMVFANVAHAQRYRYKIKLLIDSAGQRVFKQEPASETIKNLSDPHRMVRPSRNQLTNRRRAASEKRKVSVTAFITVVGLKKDGDYHLVCKSPKGDWTLIAEVPDPSIRKLQDFPDLIATYKKVRDEIDAKLGTPSGSTVPLEKPVKVKITGILFFDRLDHGDGHSKNGLEIHPVTEIVFLE